MQLLVPAVHLRPLGGGGRDVFSSKSEQVPVPGRWSRSWVQEPSDSHSCWNPVYTTEPGSVNEQSSPFTSQVLFCFAFPFVWGRWDESRGKEIWLDFMPFVYISGLLSNLKVIAQYELNAECTLRLSTKQPCNWPGLSVCARRFVHNLFALV